MLGAFGDPKPSLSPRENPSEFGDSEAETETVKSNSETTPTSQDSSSSSGHGSDDLRSEFFSLVHEQKRGISRSTSLVSGGETAPEQRLGWPLLRKEHSLLPPSPNARSMSVVQWVLSLPDRSPHQSPHCSTIKESPVEREIDDIDDDSVKCSLSNLSEVPEGFEHLMKTNSSRCKWFSLEVLKTSTCRFSSGFLLLP